MCEKERNEDIRVEMFSLFHFLAVFMVSWCQNKQSENQNRTGLTDGQMRVTTLPRYHFTLAQFNTNRLNVEPRRKQILALLFFQQSTFFLGKAIFTQ